MAKGLKPDDDFDPSNAIVQVEIFGRRDILILFMALFALGSALSGAAQTMAFLIGGRVVQGIGSGEWAFPAIREMLANRTGFYIWFGCYTQDRSVRFSTTFGSRILGHRTYYGLRRSYLCWPSHRGHSR